VHNDRIIYGYARVSTDGQSGTAQVAQLKIAGADKVFREVASGANSDRVQLGRAIAALGAGDVLMVTRLDRLTRSTPDLLNTLAAIAGKEAGFRSLADLWADTTTAHGRLILTVLGGLAEFEAELDQSSNRGGKGPRQSPRREARQKTEAHPAQPHDPTRPQQAAMTGRILRITLRCTSSQGAEAGSSPSTMATNPLAPAPARALEK
jgi:hypothetical protein